LAIFVVNAIGLGADQKAAARNSKGTGVLSNISIYLSSFGTG
jgi:hypothetical protein